MRQFGRLPILVFLLSMIVVSLACMANPHFVGGKNYIKQEVWDKAIVELEMATSAQPQNAEAWYYLGWAYGETGDFAKASGAFTKSKEISDQFADQVDTKVQDFWVDLAARGQDLAKGGQYEAAAEKFENALYLRPEHVGTYIFTADLYAGMGDVEKAAEKYEKALEIQPDNDTTLTNYAKLLEENGLDSRALPLFEKLHASRPDDANLAHHLADLYGRTGQEEKEIDLYRELGDPTPLMGRAYDAFAAERYEEAYDQYHKAMEVAPPGSDSYFDAAYNAMVSAYRAKRYEDAIALGEKLTQEKPEESQYWRLLGNSYSRVKRTADSLNALKKAQDLETGK
ncbi:MAG: tetratricopeptide repeat protein [Candidatus Eisenbacteria bacterium]|nr:tetratricopeptide repeat protein [Candidatus Eisenbacteria bacterium]